MDKIYMNELFLLTFFPKVSISAHTLFLGLSRFYIFFVFLQCNRGGKLCSSAISCRLFFSCCFERKCSSNEKKYMKKKRELEL